MTKVNTSIRGPLLISLLVVVLSLGAFAYWGTTMKLASAALAPGTVIVENRRAQVQNFEGGIVAGIFVREGDFVEDGALLMNIANAEEAANLERLTQREIALDAERLRLIAELEEAETINFSDLRSQWGRRSEVATAIAFQSQIFEVRQTQRDQAISIAQDELSRTRESITGIDAQLDARRVQLGLLEGRLADMEGMLERGVTTRVAVNDLSAQVAGLVADIAQLESARRASITEIGQKTDEIAQTRANFAVRAGDRLSSIELELSEVSESRVAALDIVSRTQVRAQISGRVVGLSVNTVGGVVASGDVLMEIVPTEDTLVVEALINPEDIDVVYPGLPVDVRLTALSFHSTLPLSGTLKQVSADRIVEGRTGAAIYKGIVTLDIPQAAGKTSAALYPGMGAEVMIRTGERTLLEYLTAPIVRSVSRAFRET